VKSQEDSLRIRTRILSSETACFNRLELQEISKVFIERDKFSKRIEYLNEIKKFDSKRIDDLSQQTEILNKNINLCKNSSSNLIKLNDDIVIQNNKLKLTRNISIAIGGVFAIIAIAK
jgi:glutamyl/glutaminyl-tRNA synthetase